MTSKSEIEKNSAALPSCMSRGSFVAQFGSIFEHSPWIAETAYAQGLTPGQDTASGLHATMTEIFRSATAGQRLEVLRAHPDLAGKLAAAKKLTAESTHEQAGAGLNALTDEERRAFEDLNERYTAKFGHPFIFSVRGRTKDEILKAFQARFENTAENEFAEACSQVEHIAWRRLEAILPE